LCLTTGEELRDGRSLVLTGVAAFRSAAVTVHARVIRPSSVRPSAAMLTGSAVKLWSKRSAAPLGQGRFKAYGAGSQPSGKIHPTTLALLKKLNYETAPRRPRGWP